MTHSLLRILASVNRILTTINGFFLGLLFQFSPIHNRKNGEALRIPLSLNLVLLVSLIIVLVLLSRTYGYWEWESAKTLSPFS